MRASLLGCVGTPLASAGATARTRLTQARKHETNLRLQKAVGL
jgi:hypothetical protein